MRSWGLLSAAWLTGFLAFMSLGLSIAALSHELLDTAAFLLIGLLFCWATSSLLKRRNQAKNDDVQATEP